MATAKSESPRATAAAADEIAARFEIHRHRVLDRDGRAIGLLPPVAEDRALATAIYKTIVLTRQFDARAVSMQRTGQLGTYPSSLGQEAVPVATASAMRADDVLLGTYREQGAYLWRGVTLVELFLYWGGDERGCDWQGPRRDFPPCITIAAHAPHAAGVAAAIKIRGESRAAVCLLGDGATSKGDFYEAVNLAGVWKLPLVFVVTNNRWAISVPLEHQTACETLAQKAIAGGFPGLQVDGNDAIAVHDAVARALARAREGGGPTLIEALTYRLSDHTTADDARRYRSEEEVSAHWAEEPLGRLRAYLGQRGWWTKEDEEALLTECKEKIDAAREAARAIAPPDAATLIFDHLYATLPQAFAAQKAVLEAERRRG